MLRAHLTAVIAPMVVTAASPIRGGSPDRGRAAAAHGRALLQRWTSPALLLGAVAVVHGLIPLVLLGPHWGFGIDESVYLSQLNAQVPAGLFSAPRARGTTFVAAPITALTDSVAAVRVWLAVLSGVGLYLAYRPWLRVRAGYAVPLAALLFSSIWSVAYYAFEAMPNEWTAFVVLAATGHTVQFLRDGRHRHLVWVVAGLAAAALFRPSDAGFAAIGLVIAVVVYDGPRRLRVRAALAAVGGTALGSTQWVIEGYTNFGGVRHRITLAQAEQGGGGLRFSGLAQVRALDGPLLCRGPCRPHVYPVFWFWWVAAAAMIVLAVAFGQRHFRRSGEMVAILGAAASAAQYLLTVSYAAPRFLIPAYALLALPCAAAVPELRERVTNGVGRKVVTGALAAALIAHVGIQAAVIAVRIKPPASAFDRHMTADAVTLTALGVHQPCLLLGESGTNPALAYRAACRNTPRTVTKVRQASAGATHVVWFSSAPPPVRFGLAWRRVVLPVAREF